MAAAAVEVSNRSVILKRHVTGFPTEADMELVTATARVAGCELIARRVELSRGGGDKHVRARGGRWAPAARDKAGHALVLPAMAVHRHRGRVDSLPCEISCLSVIYILGFL